MGHKRMIWTPCLCILACLIRYSASNCECEGDGAGRCEIVNGTCKCLDGWSGTNCSECEYGRFGTNCSETCDCDLNNTASCDSVNSTCYCKDGWTGTKCLECDFNNLETNCSEICDCDLISTASCDSVNGTCYCKSGWNGTTCSDDIDECENNPCTAFHRTVCNNTLGSYDCFCDKGYELNITGDQCLDIDECAQETSSCNQTCTNTVGSFNCSCDPGFSGDGQNCTECEYGRFGTNCSETCNCTLNNTASCDSENGTCYCKDGWTGTKCLECDFNNLETNCSAICNCDLINTAGCDSVSGTCYCKNGWNGTTCSGDIDECERNPCNASHRTVCNNTLGSYDCFCDKGYELNITGDQCLDMDECAQETSNCNQTCTNTVGSFNCLCDPGFSGDGLNCTECEYGRFGTNCSETCNCALNNTASCDSVDGTCYCKNGWNGTTCSDDIDECENNPCNASHRTVCNNTLGSYDCFCDKGYEHNITGDQCLDIDECAQETSNCNQTCTNTDGSFTCSCKPGFSGDGFACKDVNECELETYCTQNCTNTDGGFLCSCYPGYSADGPNCTECEEGNYGKDCTNICQCEVNGTLSCDSVNGTCYCKDVWSGTTCSECDFYRFGTNCSETCDCDANNTMNCNSVNATCYCKEGWTGSTCADDVDECENNNPCNNSHRTVCSNIDGSYKCLCDSGYVLNNTGDICVGCPDKSYGDNCSRTCACVKNNTVNSTEVCDHVTGNCTCMEHWKGQNCDVDINECDEKTHICSGENQGCYNTIGGFGCDCLYGYVLQNGSCVNETIDTITTTTIAPDRTSIKMKLIFNINISEAFTAAHKREIHSQLDALYRKKLTDFTIEITNLRNGSIIVEFKILFLKTNVDEFVVAILAVASTQTQIFIFEKAANLTGYEVGDIDVLNNTSTTEELFCSLYTASSPDCTSGTVCIITNGKPQCEPKKTEDNLPLILGLGIGIPAFFLALATVFLCMFFYQHNRKAIARKWKYGDNNSSANEEKVSPPRFYKKGSGIGPFMYQPGITGYPDMSFTTRDFSLDNYCARSMDTGPVNGKSSWDFLFRQSSNVPLDEKFRIKRPQVDKIPKL